jgi:hypothetical protein
MKKMKKKISLNTKLSFNKEKLNLLNDDQLTHFLGGRMAAGTGYTSGSGPCSSGISSCCSQDSSSCCG